MSDEILASLIAALLALAGLFAWDAARLRLKVRAHNANCLACTTGEDSLACQHQRAVAEVMRLTHQAVKLQQDLEDGEKALMEAQETHAIENRGHLAMLNDAEAKQLEAETVAAEWEKRHQDLVERYERVANEVEQWRVAAAQAAEEANAYHMTFVNDKTAMKRAIAVLAARLDGPQVDGVSQGDIV